MHRLLLLEARLAGREGVSQPARTPPSSKTRKSTSRAGVRAVGRGVGGTVRAGAGERERGSASGGVR